MLAEDAGPVHGPTLVTGVHQWHVDIGKWEHETCKLTYPFPSLPNFEKSQCQTNKIFRVTYAAH
jgi:hypothetical protein